MNEDILNSIKQEFSTLQQQINALNEQMRIKSKELMKESFRAFFDKYDDIVENLYWTAFTPYFNDGEACEFSVGEMFILLKNVEDACDYEGSTIHNENSIEKLRQTISDIEEWEAAPMEAAQKYRQNYISKWGRDPFAETTSGVYYRASKSSEEQMAAWRPHSGNVSDYKAELAIAEHMVANYPNLEKDFHEVANMISGIDEDLMKAMFGDHVKVIVTKSGIETEHYDHD